MSTGRTEATVLPVFLTLSAAGAGAHLALEVDLALDLADQARRERPWAWGVDLLMESSAVRSTICDEVQARLDDPRGSLPLRVKIHRAATRDRR